ncbi:XisI protein [Chloroflexi bacterium TSY]|nr:XisI protein [Chloroflexi bacterium TSY]
MHHTPIHIDIIDGKIWIQYDDTEEGVATDLVEAGVPHNDIVLGFRPAEPRQYTEFAVA